MHKLRKEFKLFSYVMLRRKKRVKTPPTEWFDVTIHKFRGRDGCVHEFYF